MKDLPSITREIQRELGVEADGRYGIITGTHILAALRARHSDLHEEKEAPARVAEHFALDARTEKNLATLDALAQPRFRSFIFAAKGTAASFGCDYVGIAGSRTFAEQDALYAQGRTMPGKIVTKARGGFSNHNFGIAMDFGVFQGRVYLDGGTAAQKALAARVHAACAVHAAEHGIEWGGSWKSFKDLPHYEIRTGMDMAKKRAVFRAKGSLLS